MYRELKYQYAEQKMYKQSLDLLCGVLFGSRFFIEAFPPPHLEGGPGVGPRPCLGSKGNLAKLSNIPESWFPHLQKEDNRRAYRMGLPWRGWNEGVGGGRSPGPVPGAHSARA